LVVTVDYGIVVGFQLEVKEPEQIPGPERDLVEQLQVRKGLRQKDKSVYQ
jgi:hypothetical protein